MDSIYDVIIIGAGPAGLACAKVCAAGGLSVVVFERKPHIGPKVCAGGITWNGLLQRFDNISQCTFYDQHIVTPKQSIHLHEKTPVVATIKREELGQIMASEARDAGAEIYANCHVLHIRNGEITIDNKQEDDESKRQKTIQYCSLVGADGSNSIVRRYLTLPSTHFAIGINYQLNTLHDKMEWHLDPSQFASGYAWIFPHKTTTSVGAYVDLKMRTPHQLKESLAQWAQRNSIKLSGSKLQAEVINFDYQGVEFCRTENIFLAGDAAGLASALTGEGIYPAVVSGEYVGRKIIDPSWESIQFSRLEEKHALHKKLILYARNHPQRLSLLSELYCFLIRCKLLSFTTAEMAK